MTERFAIWQGIDEPRIEAARIDLDASGLRASGVQVGIEPIPYRVDYHVDATDGWITRSLDLQAAGSGWSRRLRLTRDSHGRWHLEADQEGRVDLPELGGSLVGLEGALDCDLGFSPLTNTMPVAREGLARRPGTGDFAIAWVAVPALTVEPSAQRYEHVRQDSEGAIVRFVERGLFEGFTVELEYDRDGLVRVYPDLARRVG